jgi:DNA-binding transcriptional LysR family regulator
MLNHLQLEVFLKIVETGSFTKAGEYLNMTQSAVSHSIASLEKNLGVKLFERIKRTMRLTPAGNVILPHAREIFNQESIIRQKTNKLLNVEFGTIKIACFPSFMTKWLPNLMRLYNRKYPKIDFQILEGDYNEITDWVNDGKVEIGFSIESADLCFEAFVRDSMLVVLPENSPLSHLSNVKLEDIAAFPYINVKGYEKLLDEILVGTGIRLNMKYSLHNTYSIISMVEEGFGVTILPELALPHYKARIHVKPLQPAFIRTIGCIFRSFETLSPAVKTFLSFIIEQLNSGEKDNSNETNLNNNQTTAEETL